MLYPDAVMHCIGIFRAIICIFPPPNHMLRAEDLPGFFRIHADNRDLNYDNYFKNGSKALETVEQYTSHNTQRLDVEGMKNLLRKLKLFGGDC